MTERNLAPPADDENDLSPTYDNSWAIVIGIDNYSANALKCATSDAHAFASLLIDQLDFDPDKVFCILDGEHEPGKYTLVSERASGEAILNLLWTDLPPRLGRNDRVVVFFAGHGISLRTGLEEFGFLQPVDGDLTRPHTLISMTSLTDDVSGLMPAKHVLFVLDCCYSALGVARGESGELPTFSAVMVRNVCRQLFTAGTSTEAVQDEYRNSGHSRFTYHLLAGLQGAADTNRDGVITSGELRNYVSGELSITDGGQHPQLIPLNPSVAALGGEFIFSLRPSPDVRPPQLVIDGHRRPHEWPWDGFDDESQTLPYARASLERNLKALAKMRGAEFALPMRPTADWLEETGAIPPGTGSQFIDFLGELDKARFHPLRGTQASDLLMSARALYVDLEELITRAAEQKDREPPPERVEAKEPEVSPNELDPMTAVLTAQARLDEFGRPLYAMARVRNTANWLDIAIAQSLQPLVVWVPEAAAGGTGGIHDEDGHVAVVIASTPPGVEPGGRMLVRCDEKGTPTSSLVWLVAPREKHVPIGPPTNGDVPATFVEAVNTVRDRARNQDGALSILPMPTASGEWANVLVGPDSRPVRFWYDSSEFAEEGFGDPNSGPLNLAVLVMTDDGMIAVALDDRMLPTHASVPGGLPPEVPVPAEAK